MPDDKTTRKIEAPRIMPCLVEGFNAIASHVYIIGFPILFDLLLWFGPLVRIKELLLPAVMSASQISAAAYGEESQVFIDSSRQLWTALLEEFNLLFGLRTYPIGIPSLLVGKAVNENPLGMLPIIELNAIENAFWLTIAFSLVGAILGSLYFSLIAIATQAIEEPLRFNLLVKQAIQAIVLAILIFLALFIICIPVFCLFSSMALFLPNLGTLPFMLLGLILVWVLLPVAFSPHGIFANQFNATNAILNSIRLVRSLMATTGMFFIILILLGYGLDFLWATPSMNSWMLLVGIFGHAFISSGLIAASFSFYKKGMQWLQANLKEMTTDNLKKIS